MSNGMLPREDGLQFTSEQGRKMGRPSLLHVRLRVLADQTTIQVGGSAVMVAAATMFLN